MSGAEDTHDDAGATVTVGPSLTNPQALHTVDELRAELDRANGLLIRLSEDLHHLRLMTQDMAREQAKIVLLHLRGDSDAVSAAVADFCARYVKVAAPIGKETLQ